MLEEMYECRPMLPHSQALAQGRRKESLVCGPSLFSGVDYWTGLLDWTTGLTETASGGERNKSILRFTPPYRKAGLFSIAPSV